MKQDMFAYLSRHKYDVEDVGDKELDPEDDFPEFAAMAVTKLLGSTDDDPRAILLCGSGQGMAMAANRFRGIRASVVWDVEEAKMTRNDNDSNVLCLPTRVLQNDEANAIVKAWLDTPFAGAARYIRRNKQLDEV